MENYPEGGAFWTLSIEGDPCSPKKKQKTFAARRGRGNKKGAGRRKDVQLPAMIKGSVESRFIKNGEGNQ